MPTPFKQGAFRALRSCFSESEIERFLPTTLPPRLGQDCFLVFRDPYTGKEGPFLFPHNPLCP